jgi:ATP-dependent Zn protease
MKTGKSHLEATAYHEAGHAISAWRLGMRLFRVTLEPDEHSIGATLHSNPLYRIDMDYGNDSPRTQRRAENYMIVSLAGPGM